MPNSNSNRDHQVNGPINLILKPKMPAMSPKETLIDLEKFGENNVDGVGEIMSPDVDV